MTKSEESKLAVVEQKIEDLLEAIDIMKNFLCERIEAQKTAIDAAMEAIEGTITKRIELNDRRYEERFTNIDEKIISQNTDLRDYIGNKVLAQENAVGIAMLASEKAIIKAEGFADKRFEGIGDLQKTFEEYRRIFMPRTETELLINSIKTDMKKISDEHTRTAGEKQGGTNVIAWVLAGISIAGFLVMLILNFAPI